MTPILIRISLHIECVDDTIAPGEYVMPNALYVGVAALAGTIVSRKRKYAQMWKVCASVSIDERWDILF